MASANTFPELLNPSDIIAPFESSGRQVKPDIAGFVSDFDSAFIGQLQAVGVRPKRSDELTDDDRKWVLVWGWSRHLAALTLNKDRRKAAKDKRKPPFLLKVTLAKAKTDEQAFGLTVLENLRRSELSPLEVAYNMQRCMTDFGYNSARTAKRFGVSPAVASRTLKLLKLTPKLRQRLADPDDPLQARGAQATVGAPDIVVKRAEKGELVTLQDVDSAIAESGGVMAPRDPTRPGRKKGAVYRSTKQVRVLVELLKGASNRRTQGVGELLDTWMQSKLADRAAVKRMNALLEG